jgi:hypothetical protein
MVDAFSYEYPSPLEGYRDLSPLPDQKNEDGKSFFNPPAHDVSPAYSSFSSPITNGERGGFDVHVYYQATDEYQFQYVTELWERIRRECWFHPVLLATV